MMRGREFVGGHTCGKNDGTMKKTISALCLLLTLSFPALADRDNKQPFSPGVEAAPVATQLALPGIGPALQNLESDPAWAEIGADWAGLADRYAKGGGAIWVNATGLTPLGQALDGQLRAAIDAGMPADPVLSQFLAEAAPPANADQAVEIEARLGALLTALALDAKGPFGDPESRGAGILVRIVGAKDALAELRRQLPDYHPFWRLYAKLPIHVAQYRNGGWSTVPGKEKIEPGDRGPRVAAVKERLLVTGELAAIGPRPDFYDDGLKAAAQAFQRAHGLNDDGVIGVRTIEEMNVSAEERLRAVLLNLQRLREEGPAFEPRHLIVNIPGTELRVIENGLTAYYTPAIVGRPERKTPLLTSVVTKAKLNPDWSVPPKIAANDMLRHELDEPGYFAARNVRVYDSNGSEINPNSIDWRDVKRSGHFPYRLRQDPGPENALGPMKLDFKNDEAVFIHGTSAPELFAKQERFFSSGCVRVRNPLDLVAFLLEDKGGWNRARLDEIVKRGGTEFVPLPRQLPLHFVYRTAWVDEEGVTQFRRDVYKRDKKVAIPADLASAALLASAAIPGKSAGNDE